MIDGLRGVAEFMAKEVLPVENGVYKYVCTDKSRNIHKYQDKTGVIVKDPNCTKLTKVVQPVIKKQLEKKKGEYEKELKEKEKEEQNNTTTSKKSFFKDSDTLKFKLGKIFETRMEVIDMHMNNKFSNNLSNYLSV